MVDCNQGDNLGVGALYVTPLFAMVHRMRGVGGAGRGVPEVVILDLVLASLVHERARQ